MITENLTLFQIENLAKMYALARNELARRVAAFADEVRAVERRKIPGIKTALASAEDAKGALVAAIQAAPQLFEKPRTQTFSGIRVGFAKGKGALDWDDDAQLVARIKKLMPDQADVLIATKETPVANALKQLEAKELARLGVRFEEIGDYVFVKSSDGAVDKLVKKILKEGAVEDAAKEEA